MRRSNQKRKKINMKCTPYELDTRQCLKLLLADRWQQNEREDNKELTKEGKTEIFLG